MSFPLSSVAELNNLSICEIHDLSVPAAGRLQSEGADPWIIVSCDGGIRYLHLRLHFNRDYLQDGDTLCIYYLEDHSHSFSEDKCIRIPIDDSDRLEKVLCFTHPVLGLRIDPLERSGSIPLSSMLVSAFETEEQLFDSFAPAVDNGVVVVSQDLSNTGAPILAHNISCAMARKGKAVITLCCNHVSGQLAERYEQKDLALYGLFLLESADNSIPKEEWALRWLRGLRDRGYRSALLNTVISGAFAGLFKQACIHVITLVHETAETIKMHGWIPLAYELSMFSDAVIFPCTSVRDGFLELVDHIVGETVVRPQGVYLADTDSGTVSCDSLFAKLGLGPDDKLVLSSGTIELRKGTDLFISAATSLCHHCQPDEPKPLILWAGDGSDNYRTCLDIQLEHSQLADRIRFVPFMDAARYKALLRRADVFWSTSRNDTFPSVVLEAMYEGVPVVAFSGAMGVDTMLADGRGVLVNDFSPEGMALETLGLLRDAQKAKSISQKARTWVTKELSFSAYIDDLSELCGKPDIVDPAYARSILSADWDESRSNMPLGAAVPISSIRCASRARAKASLTGVIGLFTGRQSGRSSRHGNATPAFLDVSLGSDNIGDEIIMSYCLRACSDMFDVKACPRVPTHKYDGSLESLGSRPKILCGTNLIYTRMEDSVQWAFPKDLSNFDNLCMLGVGMQDIGIDDDFSPYSRELLRYLLGNGWIHSVRDEFTKRRLEEIGISNVVNTGCPTMWGLTEDHCRAIPAGKARTCVTTVTCHFPDARADVYMLETLRNEYEEVYIWLQGPYDYPFCLKGVVDPTAFKILPPSLSALDRVLDRDDVDYVGTRLHAGIRALNHGRRSLIVAVDNRARHISQDTGLPIIERSSLQDGLLDWIYGSQATRISLPLDSIETWKRQFQ